MYAMIRRYRMAAGSIDDLMHKVDTQYADRVPEEVGAVLYTAIDTGDGTALTVTRTVRLARPYARTTPLHR